MKSKKKLIINAAIILFSLFFVIPAIAFCVVNWGILPPRKLTPLVVGEVNKRINGRLECETIELTFFSTYPHLGVRIVHGNLISNAVKDSTTTDIDQVSIVDSLLHFEQATLSLRPLDYLTKSIITIGEVLIEGPHFHGYVDVDGQANWDILLDDEEEKKKEDSTSKLPSIDLQKVSIREGHFVYNDRQTDMFAEVGGFFLSLDGSVIQGGNTLAVEAGSSSILFESPTYNLENKLALRFKSNIELTDNYNTITLHDAEMMVNNLPFTADGSMTLLPDTKAIGMNLEMGLKASDLNDLLSFIPDTYLKDRNNIKATGTVLFEANVFGELGETAMPSVSLCCRVDNGSYYMKGVSQGIESLEMDMDLHLNGDEPDQSFISLEKLIVSGLNTSLDVQGQVTNLLQSPAVNMYMKGNVDFTRLAEEFLNPDTLHLQGRMDADIETSFLVADLMEGRYNNMKALGKLDIDTLKAYSPSFDMDVFISNAHFLVDSSKATSAYIAGDDLLNAVLTVDSMNVKYKEEINTNLSQLELTAKTSLLIDTSAVMPITSHIRVQQLRTRMPDSVWVVAKNAYLRGGIKSSDSNKQIPQFLGAITVDSLRYFDMSSRMGAVLDGSTFSLQALPYRDAMRERFQASAASRDSLRLIAGRDTTNRRTRRNRETPQVDSTQVNTTTGLLRNWEVRGSVSFDQMRLFSRAFPLRMQMEKSKVKFDTNTLTFSDALFRAGKSDFTLNGDVKNIRRALLRGGKLEGSFSVSSDYIDCNELIKAINQGMIYAEQQMSRSEMAAMNDGSLVEMDEDRLQETVAVNEADSTDGLFVIPAFLDMSLTLNTRQIDYKELKLENVEGEVVLRDQSINLKKLDMDSNIGHANVTMFYSAKDFTGASVGFDLDMQGILVEKLIDLYPAIDTLLPMLRSFEGIVDCQMAATCDIDSTTSVVLSTLNTGCYVYGKNMVLLDGETFTEISKTLMFKNKERNVIDSISVDLIVKDNKIEVYPFLVEIDRYRVAVGGTHNLDMTFDYHVSVLKSPVPFKLGIDVTGNLDKFKFKVAKCRYKDIFQPAKEQELKASRSNLRSEIRELIRKQIIENAPELAAVTPPSLVPQGLP